MNWLNTSARCPPPITSSELLDERVELRARDAVGSLVDEARMEAELAQQRDRAQDREAVAVEVVEQAEDLLALALQVGVVELAVARVEVDLERLLLLRRQVGGDELLGAALDERLDPPPQAREPLAVAVALDRPRVLLGEPLRDRGRGPAR